MNIIIVERSVESIIKMIIDITYRPGMKWLFEKKEKKSSWLEEKNQPNRGNWVCVFGKNALSVKRITANDKRAVAPIEHLLSINKSIIYEIIRN